MPHFERFRTASLIFMNMNMNTSVNRNVGSIIKVGGAYRLRGIMSEG